MGRPKVMWVDAKDMGADLKEVLITKEEIDAKLVELAAKIDAEYAGKDLLIVGVLKGAVMVMADLARALSTPCLLYTSPSPRDRTRSRMPSSA